MNNKGSNIYIDRQQINLIMQSQTINDTNRYDWLKDFLNKNNKDYISIDDFSTFTDEQKALIDGELYQTLYKNSSDEWLIEMYEDLSNKDEDVICALCGEKKMKYGYYLKNSRNKKTILVGSTCVETYKDLKTVDGRNLKDLKKERLRNMRMLQLDEKSTGINDEIVKWRDYENSLTIFVSKNLIEEYNTILYKINDIYETYLSTINNSKAKDLQENILRLIKQGRKIKEKMQEYVDEYSNVDWCITKEIKEWCLKNNANRAISMLREDRKIKFRSAYFIFEKNLMKKIMEIIKIYMREQNMSLKNIDFDNNMIYYYINSNKNIILNIKYKDVIELYGERVFDEEYQKVDVNKAIECSTLSDTSSIEEAISIIDFLLRDTEFNLINEDVDTTKNEAYFYDKKKGIYLKIELMEFVNKFKKYIVKSKLNNNEKEEIIHEINNGYSYTKDEYRENKRLLNDFKKKY